MSEINEREAFEKWLGIKPCGAAHDFGWAAWQARAALAATQATVNQSLTVDVVLPEPVGYLVTKLEAPIVGSELKINRSIYTKNEPTGKHQKLYTEQQVRALLATGGQAQAVPEFCHVALRKLKDLQERGYQITGYALEKPVKGAQPERGFINHGGFVGWWWDGQSPQAQAVAQDADDSALIEWLSGQYLAADFQWGDPKTPVLVIEIPPTTSVCGDFRTDVRAAIAAAKGE